MIAAEDLEIELSEAILIVFAKWFFANAKNADIETLLRCAAGAAGGLIFAATRRTAAHKADPVAAREAAIIYLRERWDAGEAARDDSVRVH